MLKLKEISRHLLVLCVLAAILILPYFVFAQAPSGLLKDVGKSAGYQDANTTSMASLAGKVISAALSLLGIIFIILMITAGINWMTAAGDEQKVTKAKDTIRRAIIGLIIVFSSWAIWAFIMYAFSV